MSDVIDDVFGGEEGGDLELVKGRSIGVMLAILGTMSEKRVACIPLLDTDRLVHPQKQRCRCLGPVSRCPTTLLSSPPNKFYQFRLISEACVPVSKGFLSRSLTSGSVSGVGVVRDVMDVTGVKHLLCLAYLALPS